METIQQNEDVIRRIYELHGEYDPNSSLSAIEQLEACEAVMDSLSPYQSNTSDSNNNDNGNLKWNDNGTCKRRVGFELTESKQKVISELKLCTYQSPPIKVAKLLDELFGSEHTKEGHWLYIAQVWNPRAITRTISQMVKMSQSGSRTIINPAGYFTLAIKYRKKRRGLLHRFEAKHIHNP